MKRILVDTENVSNWNNLKKLQIDNEDEMVLFLSQNSKPLKTETLHWMCSTQAKIKTFMFETKIQNELDAYIMSYIGIDFDKNNEYYVFSNDKIFTRTKQIYMMHDYKNIHIVTEAEQSESDLPKKSNSFGKGGFRFKKNVKNNRNMYDNLLKNRGCRGQNTKKYNKYNNNNYNNNKYNNRYNNHNKYDSVK